MNVTIVLAWIVGLIWMATVLLIAFSVFRAYRKILLKKPSW